MTVRPLLILAALPLVLTAACDGTATTGATPPTVILETGQVEPPTCERAGPPRADLTGNVVGWESVDPDGMTCLDILPPHTEHEITVRVPRAVFDRCGEGDPWPRCARD